MQRIAMRAGVLALMVAAGAAQAEIAWAVTENQSLIQINTDDPGTVLNGVFIMGVQTNEVILGIDYRPATGELYALGSFNNLYTLNTTTGMASLVGSGGFSPVLNGTQFGFDFNPTIDRIRVVSETNQNLVLNPNDGGSTGVTDVFYAAGDVNEGQDANVTSSAYTNSFMGAMTTQLYGIDSGLNVLVTQANSAGTLMTVGSLGIDISSISGFDISGETGVAYLAGTLDGESISNLWTIDLSTGAATLIGEIGGGVPVVAFAVVPAPATGVLALAGGLLMARRRR